MGLFVRAVREADGVRVLMEGDLDAATVAKLRNVLKEHQRRGARVTVDVSRIEFLDSSGLRLLMVAQADARRDGWGFRLAGDLQAPVVRLLELTAMRDRFDWAE